MHKEDLMKALLKHIRGDDMDSGISEALIFFQSDTNLQDGWQQMRRLERLKRQHGEAVLKQTRPTILPEKQLVGLMFLNALILLAYASRSH